MTIFTVTDDLVYGPQVKHVYFSTVGDYHERLREKLNNGYFLFKSLAEEEAQSMRESKGEEK